ncbi:YbaL family putative K(+) efflux transporter [Pacificimonas flava]|uniref:Putative Glutathione-regulated potassium-efflux system protein KefB n=1 Tax=Pacificimonas flava TaxID=1234595 RepID=M2TM51_9SPHN|nr:YbaL family putative K(+) efflux transporter [Pacificimonas flava]EMD82816.1 putative Glutathione-regulated potassium-efflux system protein KefB [Pacificimonas flava]MBB5279432.1 CPA2 family monovalent cation:H+ antiporter-2 [Pacificimonas flava]
MHHNAPLIAMIVAGIVGAFFMGALAHKLKVSPIAGYLLAGVLVGPFTPGYVADMGLANQLAELGVILLMFGVGLHFSLRDLLAVKNIAIPGAVAQIASATLLGMGLSWVMGWSLAGGFVFGLALSVASTVVLLRALQARNLVETERGRIAVGWLIVEDLVMVLALVLLPPLAGILNGTAGGAGSSEIWVAIAITVLKVAAFFAVMLLIGRRVIPASLHWVAHTGSRELFRLAVLAIALGVAFGAAFVFDVSFALGAFFAGMILGETPLSRRAAEETLPLRDAFAVLFFVSVGMLFNPAVLLEQPLPLLATVAIIVVGKSLAAFFIVRAFGHSTGKALTIAASLAQIGEFSFILAALGTGLGLLPAEGRDLILAGAIISIFVNPFIFAAIMRRPEVRAAANAEADAEADAGEAAPERHVIMVGYGRVGSLVAQQLKSDKIPFVIVEDQSDTAEQAERDGFEVLRANALDPGILQSAGIDRAETLLIAIPEGFEAGAIFVRARELNPGVRAIARAHSDAEVDHLTQLQVPDIVMGEREIAVRIIHLLGAAPRPPAASAPV